MIRLQLSRVCTPTRLALQKLLSGRPRHHRGSSWSLRTVWSNVKMDASPGHGSTCSLWPPPACMRPHGDSVLECLGATRGAFRYCACVARMTLRQNQRSQPRGLRVACGHVVQGKCCATGQDAENLPNQQCMVLVSKTVAAHTTLKSTILRDTCSQLVRMRRGV